MVFLRARSIRYCFYHKMPCYQWRWGDFKEFRMKDETRSNVCGYNGKKIRRQFLIRYKMLLNRRFIHLWLRGILLSLFTIKEFSSIDEPLCFHINTPLSPDYAKELVITPTQGWDYHFILECCVARIHVPNCT